MYVAKIDESNVVEQVFVMNRNKIMENSVGKPTQAKAQEVATALFGVGTYKVKLNEMKGRDRPSIGDEWNESENMFVSPRPVDSTGASCASWTLNTTNGASKLAINNSVATTSTLPFQIIDVVDSTATGSDTFQEVLVIYSTHTDNGSNVFIGGHAYRNPVGL